LLSIIDPQVRRIKCALECVIIWILDALNIIKVTYILTVLYYANNSYSKKIYLYDHVMFKVIFFPIQNIIENRYTHCIIFVSTEDSLFLLRLFIVQWR